MSFVDIRCGDCRTVLQDLPDQSVNCVVTSPPYFGLRDYGVNAQIGLESTPEDYVAQLVSVFRLVRRVLRDDGTLWLNLGDSYANFKDGKRTGGGVDTLRKGSSGTIIPEGKATNRSAETFSGTHIKNKDLIGMPWRIALALQADGWYLRQDIIWHKPNPMPESVRDRCTKAHEYLFLFSKKPNYYFDYAAMQEPAVGRDPGNVSHKGKTAYHAGDERMRTRGGLLDVGARETRNRRSVWTVPVRAFKGAHFATFPPELIEPCVRAGCPEGGTVLDPFLGAGTTALVAQQTARRCIGVELNPDYVKLAKNRCELPASVRRDVLGTWQNRDVGLDKFPRL